MDQIFSLAQIAEKMWEYDRDLYCVFIDFKQAFDRVWRTALTAVLRNYGFEESIVNVIGTLNERTGAVVRKGTIVTDRFRTECGVIQGCPLSPHLFNTYLEQVMREALDGYEHGITIGGVSMNNLRYADDIVLLAESVEQLQEMVSRLENTCKKYHMTISASKTKAMKIGRRQEDISVSLTSGTIEQVDCFKYLGVQFSENRDSFKIVRERVGLGYVAFKKMAKIWRDGTISLKLKLRLLNAIVIPTALYGSECWVLKMREKRKLLAFEMYCLRRILNIRWEQRITNDRVREIIGSNHNIVERVQDGQRRWFGHVERMGANRWTRITMYGGVHGRRPRGRPRTTWWQQFREANSGLPTRELVDLARNREEWRHYRAITWDPTWHPPDGT